MRRRSFVTTARTLPGWPIGSLEFQACEMRASAALSHDMAAKAYDASDWLDARYWRSIAWAQSHRARCLAGVEEPDDFVLGAEDAAAMRKRLRRRKV